MTPRQRAADLDIARRRVLDAVSDLQGATSHVQRVQARARLDRLVPLLAEALTDFVEAEEMQREKRRKKLEGARAARQPAPPAPVAAKPPSLWLKLVSEEKADE